MHSVLLKKLKSDILSSPPTGLSLKPFHDPIVVKILSGDGFSYESIAALETLVVSFFQKCEIQKLKEKDLHFSEIKFKKILLIIPGASDLSKITLSLEQQREIDVFCKKGLIKILAVCAGAFFVSKNIIYNGSIKKSVREVSLFDGSCIGPVFDEEMDGWKISAQKILLCSPRNEESGYLTFLGGGFFVPSDTLKENIHYKVLSRYLDREGEPVASISCCPLENQFNAVLIGPHLEYSSITDAFRTLRDAFPHKSEKIESILQKLSSTELFRSKLIKQHFEVLGLR